MAPKEKVRAIAIASPRVLSTRTPGRSWPPPTSRNGKTFRLTSKLSRHFGVPAYLDNDANMAGLAEWQFGAGKGHQDLVYITISTGIGGGVISNGCLLQGFHGMAAELGHMIIDPNGPLCGCGHTGIWNCFAQGLSIARYVNEQIQSRTKLLLESQPNVSAVQIADAARAGDALAISAFERAGYYLGIAVANYLAVFDPSILIFGGGVSQVGDCSLDPSKKACESIPFIRIIWIIW